MAKKKKKKTKSKKKQVEYGLDSFSFEEYRNDYPEQEQQISFAQEQPGTRQSKRQNAAIEKRRTLLRDKGTEITPSNRIRLAGGLLVLLVLMFALIIRMGYWQIVRADELKTMAIQMQKVDTEIEPARGVIYDSKMGTLAESVTEYELYAYTQYLYKTSDISLVEKARTLRQLVEITGLDDETIKNKLEGDENLVLIADGLTREQVEKAEELWEGKVMVKTKTARYYPNGAFAAQVLGGVNSDNVGRTGLELEYNSVLAGVKGRTVRTTDRDGNTLSGSKTKYYEPQDGKSIVTTIDSVIQHFVEEALDSGMKRIGAEAITCIVMNPKTGDVLAMATTPDYDPNNSSSPNTEAAKKKFEKMTPEEQTDYLSRMWTVRSISSIYEPGSTFKLIAAASALESGSADKKSTYNCKGYIHVGNYNLRCLGVHGKQTLKEAVGNSCNPALARVALDMGADTFYNYIDLFGFRDKTGIDLPGETNSIVKNPNGMGDVDLATTGYGQGIAVTPLQLLCAVNCFGNNGVLMQPKLVKKIIDKDGNVIEEKEDVAVRQVVSEDTAAKIADIMEYYVSDASGDRAYVPGYRVGGKTGTANLVDGGRTYSSKHTNTSFVAMAPMDDPQISMIVIVYRPTKIHYGNFTAGPIIAEIMEKSLQYLGVERKYSKSEKQALKHEKVKVPDVTGIKSTDAIRILKNYGLKYIIAPEPEDKTAAFMVLDQYPKAGKKVARGSSVYLYSE